MAITFNKGDGWLELTTIDADWVWTDTWKNMPHGLRAKRIQFIGGASTDILSIKDLNASGPEIFPKAQASNGIEIEYYGKRIRPFIDFSDCTLTAGHQVLIELG